MRAGELIDDRYQLQRQAGAGGMATVWQARDRHTDALVALKLLRDAARGDVPRFLREARILTSLESPHIVRHIGHGLSPEGEPYIAMEWLEGEDLEARLSRGPLSFEEAIDLVRHVAEALSEAHSRGVVHRDIKPSNLFLCGGSVAHVKLLDFGIAQLESRTTRLTAKGVVLGTPGYIAPEQARGEASIGPAAAVFSLGCVLFECLSGRPAFQGAHPLALLAKLLLEDAPAILDVRPDVPQPVSTLVAIMLAKSPSARLQDGGALLAALSTIDMPLSSAIDAAPVSAAPSRISRSERRHMSIVALSPRKSSADPSAPTIPINSLTEPQEALAAPTAGREIDIAQRLAGQLGGRVEALADGTILVMLLDGDPSEQAARAGRLALALQAIAQRAAIALVSGYSDLANRLPVGELVERAAALLEEALQEADPLIVIDRETFPVLTPRFLIEPRGPLLTLQRERWAGDEARTLLGKPSPFVGREWELSNMLMALEEGFEEQSARALLVTGPPGIGKSRLRHELLVRLRSRFPDMAVAIGQADSLGVGAAFSLIASALRSAMGIEAGEPANVGQQRVLSTVRGVLPGDTATRVAEFLGELIDAPFSDESSAELRAARRNGAVMAREMQSACIELTRALARRSPVLLILENLDHSDAPSVKLVDAVLRELPSERFAVVAFGRPAVHESFPRLWADRGAHEIRLGPLSRRAAEALVRAALGDTVEPARIAQILARAEGNAFYLEELVRAVQEGRGDAPPATVLGMVQARLAALPAHARRILRAASVFGQVFWRNGVIALLGRDAHPGVEETLAHLIEREFLVLRSSQRYAGEEEYSFRHALVQEAAYAMLTDRDIVAGHALAGAWLERVGEPDPSVLADHFERGGRKEKAAVLHARTAERAMRGNDLPAAAAAAARGIAARPKDASIAANLWALKARLESAAGNAERARAAAEEAIRIARPGSIAYCLALEGAIASSMFVGHTGAADAYVARLPTIEPDLDAISALARAFTPSIVAFSAAGRAQEAQRLLVRLQEIMAGRADQEPSGAGSLAHASACYELWVHCRPASAHRLFADAIRHLTLGGEGHIIPVVRATRALTCVAMGAFEEAAEHIEHTLQKARPGSMAMRVAWASLAWLHVARREFEEALRALSILTGDAGEPRTGVIDAYVRLPCVEACVALGRFNEAKREIAVLESMRQAAPICAPMAWLGRAKWCLAEGRAAESVSAAREAAHLYRELGVVPPESLLLTSAEAALALGDEMAARGAISAAHRELLSRAELIEDSAYQASFLSRVPTNARILSLAEGLLDAVPAHGLAAPARTPIEPI